MVDSGSEFSGEIEGRVRYPETGASISESSGQVMEVLEEIRKGLLVDDDIFIAVGKVVKKSQSTLSWGLQKHKSRGQKIWLIYVHQPAKFIPMPLGGVFPASQAGEEELSAFREQERQEMHRILDSYLQLCAQLGACAEKIHIEAGSIEKGIVELISQYRIRQLVMGAGADRKYSRKMVKPKSKKANYVSQHAPDFCHIWFVCKGHLIYTREPTTLDVDERPSKSSENNTKILSQELNSKLKLSDFGVYDSDKLNQSSYSSLRLLDSEPLLDSPYSSFVSGEIRTSGLESLPQTPDKLQDSSPPIVLQENCMIDDLYDKLEQVMIESENWRLEAFEDSMRRMKAERQAMAAILKAKEVKRPIRKRKELEEILVKEKEELQNAKNLQDKVAQELHEFDQNRSLESQVEESNLAMKELEEKILSAVELLQKCEEDRDLLQTERDNALREASELRKQLGEGPSSSSDIPVFFSEFSFFDLEKATNNFHPSLKIGEGGYGSIYKGFLRHTEVAVKILNPDSGQGPQEFQQEVNILSKLRHQNLVTLIGACPDAWALVYEYLNGGSLEDRLSCKDNSPPLEWHTRIRIATELCSALIFLHSSQPSSVVHGDLKPANILLDDNLVSKLSDFGICRVLSSDEMSSEQSTSFLFTEPKGTLTYIDPEFLASGELTIKSDVYSFGKILLRLLTGMPARGVVKEVQYALHKGNLNNLLDPSAGDWPFVQAEQLARIALRCCDMNRTNRPDLETQVWRVLETMKAPNRSFTTLQLPGDRQVPRHFVCPIFQEVMQDPHIAADGFTYEAEAIRGWFNSGHHNSPMTDEELKNHNVIPNLALRSAVQEWLQHQ